VIKYFCSEQEKKSIFFAHGDELFSPEHVQSSTLASQHSLKLFAHFMHYCDCRKKKKKRKQLGSPTLTYKQATYLCIGARVTRLGEFSPFGPLITLYSFFNYRSSPNFLTTIFHGKSYVLILIKNGLGFPFGRFFHKLI
jgi:hypothetical protein